MEIRLIQEDDLEYLKTIIESTKLFPSELLDEMVSDFFTNDKTQDIWLTKIIDNIPIGIVYCAPERMTEGTFNLFLIAVHSDFQKKGIGKELILFIEQLVKQKNGRILIVETSSLPEFEATRIFYKNNNYNHEATIREFYKQGEDKIVFWKKLAS